MRREFVRNLIATLPGALLCPARYSARRAILALSPAQTRAAALIAARLRAEADRRKTQLREPPALLSSLAGNAAGGDDRL